MAGYRTLYNFDALRQLTGLDKKATYNNLAMRGQSLLELYPITPEGADKRMTWVPFQDAIALLVTVAAGGALRPASRVDLYRAVWNEIGDMEAEVARYVADFFKGPEDEPTQRFVELTGDRQGFEITLGERSKNRFTLDLSGFIRRLLQQLLELNRARPSRFAEAVWDCTDDELSMLRTAHREILASWNRKPGHA